MKTFLKTHGTKIIRADGRPVILKGVNLGGWLMMEGYILHARNLAEQNFKKNFAKALGEKTLREFEEQFRNSFIEEKDIKTIAGWDFNCVRVPFNYRLIEKKPFRYAEEGVSYLDKIVNWCQKYNLWAILDLHAAAGAQNHDWHSDSLGKADLWNGDGFKERTYRLWEFLADRYKDHQSVAGYDLLNEAVIHDAQRLNNFYKNLIKRIRRVDKNHILFVEGNTWAVDLDCLERFEDDNYVLSVHAYQPLDFTFNLIPHLSYPSRYKNSLWNKEALKRSLRAYKRISELRLKPVFVGEFGVNSRNGNFGEDAWVKDMVSCFKDFGFSWAYWTYKAVKNSTLPDGVISYMDNPVWVNRQGPMTGWETYASCWPNRKREIIQSWRSRHFQVNTLILNALLRRQSRL